MGFFKNLFGTTPEKPKEASVAVGLPEEKEKEWMEKEEKMGEPSEKPQEQPKNGPYKIKEGMSETEEKEWMEKGDDESRRREGSGEKQ